MSTPTGRAENEFTVFGRRAVLEALASPGVMVLRLASARQPPDFRAALAASCAARRVTVESVSETEVSRLSGEPRYDQGVVALIRLTTVGEAEPFVQALAGPRSREPARVLALDGVTNPQNVGMVVRSAAAAGMTAILWPRAGMPWINGLIIKSSASTIYRLPVVRCHTLAEGLYTLKGAGFSVLALCADSRDSLFSEAVPHRACFVIGGETTGVSDEVLDLADRRLSIPMAPGVESLNAGVAAALVCYAATGLLPRATR